MWPPEMQDIRSVPPAREIAKEGWCCPSSLAKEVSPVTVPREACLREMNTNEIRSYIVGEEMALVSTFEPATQGMSGDGCCRHRHLATGEEKSTEKHPRLCKQKISFLAHSRKEWHPALFVVLWMLEWSIVGWTESTLAIHSLWLLASQRLQVQGPILLYFLSSRIADEIIGKPVEGSIHFWFWGRADRWGLRGGDDPVSVLSWIRCLGECWILLFI